MNDGAIIENPQENTVIEKEKAAKMLDNYNSVIVDETVGVVFLDILAIILFIPLRNSKNVMKIC